MADFIKPRIFFVMLLLFAVNIISGCIKEESFSDKELKGTEGITIDFIKDYPQEKYTIEKDVPVDIILEIRNKGAYPETEEQKIDGKVYISGFDKSIIDIEKEKDLADVLLPSAFVAYPEGSLDNIQFDGKILSEKLRAEKYEANIMATLCYSYATKAAASVCVDTAPLEKNKVCSAESKTLTSQGAPVAVTRIDEEVSSDKIHFKISISNAGNGDVINREVLEKCNPYGDKRLERDDFDKVELVKVTLGQQELKCNAENNKIRLFNGQGFAICTLDKEDFKNIPTFTSPLNIELKYGYKSTILKQINVLKVVI
ncbi:hypothetical protein HYX01_02135 [Candidatus Woesearchaeota archaeon]|nr:hypothetical protein [Candidatus Woesearchaeota archaeon]